MEVMTAMWPAGAAIRVGVSQGLVSSSSAKSVALAKSLSLS